MKRFCGFLILVTVCVALVHERVSAQSLTVKNRTICRGASIPHNVGLYELPSGWSIVSLKAGGTGADLKGEKHLTPAVTTTYHITYKDASGKQGTETATVTVTQPPVLKISLTNPASMPASGFCPGVTVSLDAKQASGKVYWTISTETESQEANKVSYTLKESCWVRAQSYNDCGFVDTSIYFVVRTVPALADVQLELDTVIKQPVCLDCGFYPDVNEIVKGVKDGQAQIKSASITWADGSTNEEIIKATAFEKKVNITALVESKDAACGAASDTKQEKIELRGITLKVEGKDCKPQMQNVVTLKPCEERGVYLRNVYTPDCKIQGEPTLVAIAGNKVKVTKESPFLNTESTTAARYQWQTEWENYSRTDPAQVLRVKASYQLTCHYSRKNAEIKTFEQDIRVHPDTTYLKYEYKYCPDPQSPAELEISGTNGLVKIEEIQLSGPSGDLTSRFTLIKDETYAKAYKGKENVTNGNLGTYQPLRAKVRFKVDKGNCHFEVNEDKTPIRLSQRTDCKMKLIVRQSSPCIGMDRTLALSPADGAVIDYIELEPSDKFELDITDKQTFKPYYAGAPAKESEEGEITATAYFHMGNSSEIISMTEKINLKVESCPPIISDNVRISPSTCPMCPGAQMRGTIKFQNSTTREEDIKVDIYPLVTKKASAEKYSAARSEYTLNRYLFGDMDDYRVVVAYNEGKLNYTKTMDFSVNYTGEKGYGETVTNKTIKMATVCSQVKEVEPDSVCEGEVVDLYVYSQNFVNETLEKIVWNDPMVKAVGNGIEDWNDYRYTDEKGTVKTKKIKRFHYQVEAKGNGVYPCAIYTTIGDSALVRLDTVRVAVLSTPRIFIQDTIYACDNQPLDLRPYIDATVVDMSSLTANELIVQSASKGPLSRTARLKYKCSRFVDNKKSETVTILAEEPVYNSWISDTAYCPGERIKVKAGTNGRTTWVRRVQLPGGGFSQPDTLLVNEKEDVEMVDQMGASHQLYTVTARTACPSVPPISVQFWAKAKPVPEVIIKDNSACRPSPLLLQTEPFDPLEVDSAKGVKWYVNGQAYGQPSVPPANSVSVRCEVTGRNGCTGSDEITMKSYDAPDVKIGIEGTSGSVEDLYCATVGDEVPFTGKGAAAFVWKKASQTDPVSTANKYIFRVQGDDELILVGTENGCSTERKVSIVVKPKAQVQSDTTACLGSYFRIDPVPEAGVSLRLVDPKGKECACSFIKVENYAPEDAGVYTFFFDRKGCVESRQVDLKMYPVPAFDYVRTAFCEGENLLLDVKTGLDAAMQAKSRFTWYDKDGRQIDDKMGQASYTGNRLSLADGGGYRLHIRVDDRCDYEDTVDIKVDPHSHPAFEVDPFYCEGADFTTKAEDQGPDATYGWYSTNRPHLGQSPQTKLELGELMMEDSAFLKLTVYRGACVDDTSIFIHVRSMPKPEITPVGTHQDEKGEYYCEGSPVRLDVADARNGDTIEWYLNGTLIPGAASGSYGVATSTLQDAGKYGFKVRRNGCNGETSVYVDVRVLPVPLVRDTFMCSGKILVMDASNASYPGATFAWAPTGTTGGRIEIEKGDTYTVRMLYEGCEDSKSFFVEERPSPVIGFPADTVMCQRDSILLVGPAGMESYRWQDGSTGQSYLVTAEGLYSLFVELTGCSDFNEVLVSEDFCSNLYFPSAFSPNGDAVNDRFGPITTAEDDQVVYALYIYNRNGEKVFESHSLTESWDGTYKGEKCPGGVYVYRCIAHARQNGRKLSADGTVTLLR